MQANKHVLYKIYRKKQQRKPSKTEDFQFVESQSKFFSEKKKKILEVHKWKSRDF